MASSKVNSKFTFQIQSSEYGKYDTSNVTIDANLAAKYSSSVVEKAKELKAKHGTKYSDEFYLNYAKNNEYKDLQGALLQIYQGFSKDLPIQDITWAQYSYEEIIEMENSGYQIPEDVLLWAHAQQQSDVTDYIIVSESTDSSENSSTDAATGADELSRLQKVARENIIKTEDALDKSEEKFHEYKKEALNANFVKKQNEDTYKESMEKIKSDAKEWKRLDDKKNSGGKLSFTERLKYNTLSKKLKSSDTAATKELEKNNTKLESYLESLEGLQNDLTTNAKLAADTIQSGRELSNYDKPYQEEKTPYVNTGIRFNGSGISSDTLYDIPTDEIANIAVEKGDELNQDNESVSSVLENSKNVELAEFAQSYVTLAQEINDDKINIMNGDNTEESGEEEDQTQDSTSSSKSNSFSVDMTFSDTNAKVAAATTMVAMANLLVKNVETNKEEKSLRSLLKKSESDTQKVSKEASKTEQVENKNKIRKDEDLAQIEEAQTSDVSDITEDKSEKTDELVQDIENADNEDVSVKASLQKLVKKGQTSTSKASSVQKLLKTKNQELMQTNNNASQVAAKTVVVGAGTIMKSFISNSIGTDLYLAGVPLLASPLTVAEGQQLIQEGTAFIAQGISEFSSGTLAAATGAAGLVASSIATEVSTGANRSIKDALRSVKDSKTEFKQAAEDENQETTTVNDTSTSEDSTEDVQNSEENQTNNSTDVEETNNTEISTEETSEVEGSETSEDTEQTEQTDDTIASGNTQTSESVSLGFGYANAIAATNITNRATSQMLGDKNSVRAESSKVSDETKKSANIINEIEKNTAMAEAKHETNLLEAESLAGQISSEQSMAANSEDSDAAISAQTKAQDLSSSLDEVIEEDSSVAEPAEDAVTSGVKQLAKYQKNTESLQNNITELNKDIATQLDDSIKTTIVGAGTTALGIKDTINGYKTISQGIALLSNPLTSSIGATLVATGTITLATGMLEDTTGLVASATGADGISENSSAKSVSKDAQAEVNSSTAKMKTADKSIQTAVNALLATEEMPEDTTSEIDNATDEEDSSEDETIMAAAASGAVNVDDIATTDDKMDKKLFRFNSDSMINSKKKNKKVLNVFASMTNKKGKK